VEGAFTALLATVVDTGALLKTIAAAFVAGVGITLAFSLAILGATRFVELRRDGRSAEAGAFALLGAVALVACIVAIVFGMVVMLSK
jgi:hypothetical protein